MTRFSGVSERNWPCSFLTAEEEVALALKIEEGDQEAKQRLRSRSKPTK